MSFDQIIQRFLCVVLSPLSFRAGGAHVWSDGRCILCGEVALCEDRCVFCGKGA